VFLFLLAAAVFIGALILTAISPGNDSFTGPALGALVAGMIGRSGIRAWVRGGGRAGDDRS
jgi:hypothetical protein